jgi:hypothetical protein
VALASTPGAEAKAERREALARAYVLDRVIHPVLPLHLALAYREIRDWVSVERVCRNGVAIESRAMAA